MPRKIWLFPLFFLIACTKTAPIKETKAQIVVTIPPYHYFVQRIVQEEANVQTLVPMGANPHLFEPTAKQVLSLKETLLWIRNGEAFEEKISPSLKSQNPSMEEVFLAPPSHGKCCHVERHPWMSPKESIALIDLILQRLTPLFPEHKETWEKRGEALKKEFVELDQEIKSKLKTIEHKTLLVSHPAFFPFCKEYGMKELSIEFEGKETRPHHLQEVMEEARQGDVCLAITLPQHNNKGTQQIAQKLHLPLKMVDPYAPNSLETLRNLTEMILQSDERP